MDTYKVGTTANSCSTMHKIHSKEFSLDDFSIEHLKNYNGYREEDKNVAHFLDNLNSTIENLNTARKLFLQTGDKQYWWQMIQLLPSSYNQKRTWTANYETLRNIYQWRRGHKLDEWHDFCRMIEELPYGKELICYNIGGNENEA
jgi:hypothetical protein